CYVTISLIVSPFFPYTTLFRSRPEKTRVSRLRFLGYRGAAERLSAGALAGRKTHRQDRPGDDQPARQRVGAGAYALGDARRRHRDRKSTRLNSSHGSISYAVVC